jgi:hypothetical protein
VCALPVDPGPCLAAIPRYAFSQTLGICVPFTYGGCNGNGNNFASSAECYDACGLSGDFHAAPCASPTDCTVIVRGCCGNCSLSQPDPLVAVNRGVLNEYFDRAGCFLADCPACDPPVPDETGWFGATCKAGFCALFDARETSVTECTADEDCALRLGLECCEGCSTDTHKLVAVNPEGSLASLVCGDDPVGCPGCEPVYPSSAAPRCDMGRCVVAGGEAGAGG